MSHRNRLWERVNHGCMILRGSWLPSLMQVRYHLKKVASTTYNEIASFAKATQSGKIFPGYVKFTITEELGNSGILRQGKAKLQPPHAAAADAVRKDSRLAASCAPVLRSNSITPSAFSLSLQLT